MTHPIGANPLILEPLSSSD